MHDSVLMWEDEDSDESDVEIHVPVVENIDSSPPNDSEPHEDIEQHEVVRQEYIYELIRHWRENGSTWRDIESQNNSQYRPNRMQLGSPVTSLLSIQNLLSTRGNSDISINDRQQEGVLFQDQHILDLQRNRGSNQSIIIHCANIAIRSIICNNNLAKSCPCGKRRVIVKQYGTGTFRHQIILAEMVMGRLRSLLGFYWDSHSVSLFYSVKDGTTLTDILNRHAGGLNSEDMKLLSHRLLLLLQFLSSRGVIHNNIHPDHVLVCYDDKTLMLTGRCFMDVVSREGTGSLGDVTGINSHCSPELSQGIDVEYSSDTYSVGVLLLSAITGIVPYFSVMDEIRSGPTRHSPRYLIYLISIGKIKPNEIIHHIEDGFMKNLILDMIRQRPADRSTADSLLQRFVNDPPWRDESFLQTVDVNTPNYSNSVSSGSSGSNLPISEILYSTEESVEGVYSNEESVEGAVGPIPRYQEFTEEPFESILSNLQIDINTKEDPNDLNFDSGITGAMSSGHPASPLTFKILTIIIYEGREEIWQHDYQQNVIFGRKIYIDAKERIKKSFILRFLSTHKVVRFATEFVNEDTNIKLTLEIISERANRLNMDLAENGP